jgi:hypothetical protein
LKRASPFPPDPTYNLRSLQPGPNLPVLLLHEHLG